MWSPPTTPHRASPTAFAKPRPESDRHRLDLTVHTELGIDIPTVLRPPMGGDDQMGGDSLHHHSLALRLVS